MLVPAPARPVPWLRFVAVAVSLLALVMGVTYESPAWGVVWFVASVLTVVV